MLSKKIDLERNRPLWGKRQAFFPPIFFSSCQSWWKVCTIFAETQRQVSYYTTMVLKTTQHTHLFFFFLLFFLPMCMWVILPTQRFTDMSLYWMTAVRTRLFVELVPERDRVQHRRREKLSEAFWSDTNVISWCHVLSALLFTSPL